MTLTARLVIQHAEDGQPLPYLEVEIDGSTYRLMDGSPVKDWKPGCVTERIASVSLTA